MADNAAQSIKDLGTDIEKLDKKIKDSIDALKSFGVNVNDLFAKARESGIANTDKLVTYLAKRLSNLQIKNFAEPFIKSFGIKEAKQEVDKVPTMFDRVIEQINQKAKQAGDNFAKKLVDAEGVKSEAQKAFAALKSEYEKAAKGLSSNEIANQILLQRGQVDLSMLTTAGRKKYLAKMEKEQSLLGVPQVTPELVQNIARAQNALNAAQQRYAEVLRQSNAEQEKFAAKLSAIQGVSDKYNNINTQIENLRNKFAELYVKKEAGLIDEATFKKQSDAILNKYDELIKKRNEFETATNIDAVSSERQRQRLQEEERLAQIERNNTQERVDRELRAERTIKQAKAEKAKKEAEADANMKKAVSQQMANLKQLSSLQKQYNQLKDIKGRTNEENAALEQTKKKIKEIVAEMYKLNKEQYGSLWKARDITEYDRILARDKEITRERQKQNDLTKQQKANLDRLLQTLQRLASAFGVAFSVRGLAQFGKKLIETRGEFEMQFVAMKQIIGDVDAATKIWNQTMQQALQSPFKAMQLVTYTKQLAAYRIETEKLFDTTKRLADISAGLGVDMQRLILAYGQVKAANFLRASEIRQFTEAGVNVLGELSKYFTEIEGRAVSTAQVMERVTKRMVRFEDVEEIFKRMTDEGGQFFEMQEVQADTVKGQINKLHDAYDQMLNTIGKANQGTLKNMISALNRIIRNWDKVVARLKVITGLFLTYKVAQATAAIQMIKAGKAADAQSLGISGLTARLVNLIAVEKSTTESTLTLSAALKQLNSSKGGWIGVAVSAALTAAIAIADYYKRAHQLSKDLSQITTDTQIRARKSTTDYEQMAEKIRDVNTSEKERQETLSKLKRMYEDILPARMLEIEYITKEGNAYNDAKESIRAYYEEKRKQEALDKVYETYSKDVTDNQEHFASVISDIINKQTGLAVSTREINIVIDELVERFKKGEVSAQNYFEVLNQLLNTQIGVTIDREKLSKTGEGVIETFGDAVKIDEWAKGFLESVSTLDEKLEEAGANATEFGKSIKDALDTKVFDEVEKSIEKGAKALSDATFNEELDFEVSNYEKRAREAFEAFKTTFKEEYDKNPQFFEDQFEIKLKFNLEEKGIQYAKDDIEKQGKAIEHSVIDNQKTINSEIEKLAEQTSISDKEILRQFQVDTSVEFDKWIQNQLSKIDLYKTDLLRIQKGLTSDMTDEHIAMLQTLEPFLPLWEEYLKGLTPAKKTKTTRTTHENASKLISLIKEMRSEYDKLSKYAYGYAKSEEKVREAYKDSVKEILGDAGITDYDFTTNEGMIAALEKVKSFVQGSSKYAKDAWKDVQKYIDQLETEIEINAQVKIREDFGKQMEKMFSDYELTIDLKKLSLPTDELQGIFDFDYTTLDMLRKKVDEFYYQKIAEGADPTDLVKQMEGYYKKIDEMEKKELRERLKTYTKYLEEGQNEALKIHLEELKKMAELDKLYEQGYFTDTQYKDISKAIKKETDEKLAKNNWQQFKETDFYITMFEDLSKVSSESIDIMIKRLKALRKNIGDLDPKQAKEIVKTLEKLEKVKLERSPLKSFFADIKTASEWRKTSDDLAKRIDFYANSVDYYKKEQEEQSKVVAGLKEKHDLLVENGQLGDAAEVKKRLDFEEEELSNINEILDDRTDKLNEANEAYNKGYAAQKRVYEGLAQGAQYFSELASTAGTISTEIMDMFDGVSDASKKLAKDIAEIATNVGLLAADIAKAIASEGTDVSSMIDGIVRTWYIIKGAMSASESAINETIESNTDKLKDLEEELERVQKAREKAWNTHDYVVAEKEIEQDIYDQIAAYDALIAAEEQRKSSDKDQIRTWKQEREELFDQLEEEKEQLLQDFGGIGESEYKSAAQGFVDAWKSAFLETGDGLQGLQDHFDEFLQDWFVKQATMQGVATYYQKVFDYINDIVKGGNVPTEQDIENARLMADDAAVKSDELMQAYARIFGLGGEGSLSGLAAGIQGMTEEQANILEAYWNQVRMDTQSIADNVATIVGLLSNGIGTGGGGGKGVDTNPQLVQLEAIAGRTNDIYRLLDGLRFNGGEGLGFRVYSY